jgi:hypothetical protein
MRIESGLTNHSKLWQQQQQQAAGNLGPCLAVQLSTDF